MENNELEVQRQGRNKDTTINRTYIESSEYRKKFDHISDADDLNRLIYQLSKRMLHHRTGTTFEDMYWIDIDTLEVVAEEVDGRIEKEINYSRNTKNVVLKYKQSDKNLLTIHSHPNSFPPSIVDFNSNFDNDYGIGLVICHNGKIYMYSSNECISEDYYNLVVADYLQKEYNDIEAQLNALDEIKKNFNISIKEVV